MAILHFVNCLLWSISQPWSRFFLKSQWKIKIVWIEFFILQNCLMFVGLKCQILHFCLKKKNLSFGEIPGVLFRRRPLGFRTVQGDRIGSHRNLTNWSMRLLDQRSNKQQMKSPGFLGVWKDDLIDQKWRDVHFAQGGLQFYEMRRWNTFGEAISGSLML